MVARKERQEKRKDLGIDTYFKDTPVTYILLLFITSQ
jgi:hypothetical protein